MPSTTKPAAAVGKKLLFVAVTTILGGLFVECGAHVAHFALRGEFIPVARYGQKIEELSSSSLDIDLAQSASQIRDPSQHRVLHPFIGSVMDHSRFLMPSFWRKQPPDAIRVGIFGGSFAGDVFGAMRTLESRIRALTGRSVEILSFAIAGGKQPQQLMSLVYMQVLGERLDVVLNIDGFNEVTLAHTDNIPKGVFPAYPRDWYYRAAAVGRAELSWQRTNLLRIAEQRADWARWFTGVLGHSGVGLLLWKAADNKLIKQYEQLHIATRDTPAADTSPSVSGPQRGFKDRQELDRFLAQLWLNSSLQMHAIARANGAVYAHFLQPNQYVPGSKPMSSEERAIAILSEDAWGQAVKRSFPILREMGAELRAADVSFHDLTDLFSRREEVLYRDACCHLNQQGYRIVADTIVDALAREHVWEHLRR